MTRNPRDSMVGEGKGRYVTIKCRVTASLSFNSLSEKNEDNSIHFEGFEFHKSNPCENTQHSAGTECELKLDMSY